MKVRVYPRIVEIEQLAGYLGKNIVFSAKAWEERKNRKLINVPFDAFKKYLNYWYPETFTFTEEYAETEVNKDNENWYEWHIAHQWDNVKFVDGKMRNGFIHI